MCVCVLRSYGVVCMCRAGVVGMEKIVYSGAYPVSRLALDDDAFEAVDLTLYAYSALMANDMVSTNYARRDIVQ